jgi:hypothetical protein
MNSLESFLLDKTLKLNKFFDPPLQLINDNKYIFQLHTQQKAKDNDSLVPFQLKFFMN